MQTGVSVIIPTYNCAPYLKRCIRSVIDQTRKVDEILVIDDASTDHTKSLINELQKDLPNLIYLKRESNSGNAGIVRNQGLVLASRPIVAFLDADDTWETHHIAECLKAFDLFPDAGFAFAKYGLVDERELIPDLKDKYMRRDFTSLYPEIIDETKQERFSLLNPGLMLKHIIRGHVGFHFSSVVLNRTTIKTSFHFDPLVTILEDIDFVMQLLFSGVKPVYLDSIHTRYYIHGDNTIILASTAESTKITKLLRLPAAHKKQLLYCRDNDDYRVSLLKLATSYWWISAALDSVGNYAEAHTYYVLSFCTRPTFVAFKHICMYRLLGERGKSRVTKVVVKFREFLRRFVPASS